MFGRRAMWDGAVVAYCRCFKTGRQRALLGKMLDSLNPSQRARHDEAMHWRDKHIAHRVDKKLETVMVVAIVDAADQVVEVEGRVTTSMFPADGAIAEFAEVVNLLKGPRLGETLGTDQELARRRVSCAGRLTFGRPSRWRVPGYPTQVVGDSYSYMSC